MKKLTFLFWLMLSSCATNLVLAPDGTVPKRSDLGIDPYGGYITIIAAGETISGEFLGLRNDSLMVLSSNQVVSKPLDQVTFGRLIAHDPNSYLAGGLIPMIPNALLLTIEGYGASPLVTALVFSGINLSGMGIASATEERKVNYFEWEKEKEEILKYSRFPGGIPEEVELGKLMGRSLPVNRSKGNKRSF